MYKTTLIRRLLLLATISIISCDSDPPMGVDYHVHIRSAEMAKQMEKLCGTLMRCPGDTVAFSDMLDVIPSFDSTAFQHAVILSMGYMASMPELRLDAESHKRLTRHENEFAISEASKSDKLSGFFSVNPLTDYAIEEAQYWMKMGNSSGLKLHLANSDFDFFNADHLQKLRSLLNVVDDPSMGILAHIRTRNPNYGTKDMEVFLTQVLPHTSKATWVIAHAGGWGGYDQATDSVLAQVIDAIHYGQIDKNRIYLDIAYVVLPEAAKRRLPYPRETLAAQEEKFVNRFRSLEISHWVFGSDWSPTNNTSEPYAYIEDLKNAGFEENELNDIIQNKLPFIR